MKKKTGLLTQQRKSDAEHKDHDTAKHGYEEVAGQHDHHHESCGVLLLHSAEDVFIVCCPHEPCEYQHHNDSSKDHVEGTQKPGMWGQRKINSVAGTAWGEEGSETHEY